jgi:molybdopterin converting factor small subunit
MANQQKKSQTHPSGTLAGLKWYWWILIAILAFFIISSLVSSLFGLGGGGSSLGKLLSDLMGDILGIPLALLGILAKSPFAWFMVGLWALPTITAGMGSAYKAYREHAGPDKSEDKKLNEAGMARSDFEKRYNELKKQNPNLTKEQLKNAVINDRNNNLYNKIQTMLKEEGKMSNAEINQKMRELFPPETKKDDGGAEGVEERNPELPEGKP